MVVFPNSTTEPVFLNCDDLEPHDYSFSIDITEDINTKKIKDEAFSLPRVMMTNGETDYALQIETLSIIEKLNIPVESINTEPVVVKKVAANLKCSDGQKDEDTKGISGDNPDNIGGGSSSNSFVTIFPSVSTISYPNDTNVPDGNGNKEIMTEKWCHTILQVSVPFFIAGIGTIGAGYILNTVKNWKVFKDVSQLLILVPALLGLKGNLDMCLASRLSTQANLGNMNILRETVKMIIGNMALVQIQAIVAALCVALFAMTVSAITADNIFVWSHALLLVASSISTATSSCFVLDFLLITVIMLSYQCKMNPDNLATPLAASFGDIVSISVLAGISSQLYLKLQADIWILYVILVFYLILLPCWVLIVLRNKYTTKVLKTGWIPVLSALFISGFGGLILDRVVRVYNGFTIFQPIINGIGGNLVSVQASRISTMLHRSSVMGVLPSNAKIFVTPWKALFKGSPSSKTALMLMGMAIIGHLIFVFVADYVNQDNCTLNVYYVFVYMIVAVLQVIFLLYIAHIMIHAMWRFKIDPDNSAIPYLTALGDLSGSLFLALAFWFIHTINKEYCAAPANTTQAN